MRRFAGIVAALPLALAARGASAQDLKPPDPIPADAQGSPNAQPGQPGATQQQTTQQQLEESEKEDSGRNFELFWVRGELGGSYLNLQQFDPNSLSIQKDSGGAFSTGIAAGLRLLIFTFGPRFRYHAGAINFAQIDGELGFHFGSAKFDPFISLHGGYSFLVNGDVATAASDVSVRGFNAGMSFGFDYYLTSLFSLGFGLTGEALFLKRPPVDLPAGFNSLPAAEQARIKNDPLYANSASSAGLGITGALQLGLHFGL